MWIPSESILGTPKQLEIFDYTIEYQAEIENINAFKMSFPNGTSFSETIETIEGDEPKTITTIICIMFNGREFKLLKIALTNDPFTEWHYVFYELQIEQVKVKPFIELINSYKAHIKGYYENPFTESLEYLNKNFQLVQLYTNEKYDVWDQLNLNDVEEMTAFYPDPTRRVPFDFIVKAVGVNEEVIEEKIYQVIVFDPDWTPGRNALVNAVNSTR